MSTLTNREKPLQRAIAAPLGTANAAVSGCLRVKPHHLEITNLRLDVAASYSDHS